MKIEIDTETRTLTARDATSSDTHNLHSPEAFTVLSRLWLRTGWALGYEYGFSWMGRPIIQLPDDLLRVQEVIYRVRPHVLVETGVAHGGSLVFYASLFRAMGQGRVIGIDIDIRAHNRKAIEDHELAPLITLVQGSSIDPSVVGEVRAELGEATPVLVVLDSNHSRAHVAAELEAYAPLVSPNSYMVVTDGIMEDLHDVPPGRPEWRFDNPRAATAEFLIRHSEFELEEPPPFPFNEGQVRQRVTHWPDAYLRRIS